MTRQRRSEEWLWDLPRAADRLDESDERIPSDERLRAWRAGEQSAAEARRTAWALARSGAARQRLVEIAGVKPAAPPDPIRRVVVDGAAPTVRRRQAWLRGPALAAAALLIAMAVPLAIWLTGQDRPAPLPDQVRFDVSVEGQAVARGSSGQALTDPNGRVKIQIEPEGDALVGLEFGIYVPRGERLERIRPEAGLTVEAIRGAALLTVDARALTAGASSGTHPFFVVAARSGNLPAVHRPEPGASAAEALADRTGGRVYERSVTVRPTERPSGGQEP